MLARVRNIAIGEFFLNIGKAILLLAFAKLLYDETGQIWAFSAAYVGSLILALVIPFFAGGAVDRTGSKNVLRISAGANALVCMLAVATVDFIGVSVIMLLLTSMILSSISPIIKMSIFTITPELSRPDELEKNNGSLTFAFQFGQLIGMGMAAWLLKAHTLKTIFITVSILNVAAFVFYFLAATRLSARPKARLEDKHLSLKSLVKIGKMSVPYLPVFLFSNFDFAAIAIFNVLLAAVVFNYYDNDPAWLSGLDASFAIGALIAGVLVANQWGRKRTSINDPIMTQCYFVVCLIAFLVPGVRYLAPLAVALFGMSQSYSGIFWLVRLQKEFPAEYKGRLAAARSIVSSIYTGLATLLVSFAHQIGFKFALAVVLVYSAAQGLIIYSYKKRRSAPLARALTREKLVGDG